MRERNVGSGKSLVWVLIGGLLAACSGSAGDDVASCSSFPVGVYKRSPASIKGDTGLCVDAATALSNGSNKTATLSISKVDDSSYEVDDGDGAPTTYTFDRASCALTHSATTTSDVRDQANKAIKLTSSGTTTITASGDTLTMEAVLDLSSETSGALGVPCTITLKAAATKSSE